MEKREPTARVERAAREDRGAVTADQVRRRNVLRQFVPAADRLSDAALAREMSVGMAVAAEAVTEDDIPTIAFRYETRKRRHQHAVTVATRIWQSRRASGMTLRSSRPDNWGAVSGSSDSFKSPWERRLARAFDRLGMSWAYEAESLTYTDGTTRVRRYFPDFTLRGYPALYIEVKGPTGADQGDAWKMQRVLQANPWAVLLLWDAGIIEYVEQCTQVDQVLALIDKTRLHAASLPRA